MTPSDGMLLMSPVIILDVITINNKDCFDAVPLILMVLTKVYSPLFLPLALN